MLRASLPALTLVLLFVYARGVEAQKPRLLQALDTAAKSALVLRGACETVLQSVDDEGEPKREADATEWKGTVELVRAPNGQILLGSVPSGKPAAAGKASFAILMKGETRIVEARFGARRVALGAFSRALPRLFDWGNLRKWVQRAAARGRLRARPDPAHKDGRQYRIRLPARAVLPEPAEDDEEGDEDEDDEELFEPAARRMLVHVDLVLRIDEKNALRALQIELHETAPLIALERAWKRATKKVKDEQQPRLRIREDTMRELEDELRRVRVLKFEVAKKESEETRAALERMMTRLR